MKLLKTILLITLFSISIINQAQAAEVKEEPAVAVEEKHAIPKDQYYFEGLDLLEKLQSILKLGDNEEEEKLLEWVNSLSKEEFIRGTKQCNDCIVRMKIEGVKDLEPLSASYIFVYSYFKRFPDENPRPFLEMAVNKENDADFRKGMLNILACGGDMPDSYKLKLQHLDTFSNILLKMAQDNSNSTNIRKAALYTFKGQLGQLKAINQNNKELSQKVDQLLEKTETLENLSINTEEKPVVQTEGKSGKQAARRAKQIGKLLDEKSRLERVLSERKRMLSLPDAESRLAGYKKKRAELKNAKPKHVSEEVGRKHRQQWEQVKELHGDEWEKVYSKVRGVVSNEVVIEAVDSEIEPFVKMQIIGSKERREWLCEKLGIDADTNPAEVWSAYKAFSVNLKSKLEEHLEKLIQQYEIPEAVVEHARQDSKKEYYGFGYKYLIDLFSQEKLQETQKEIEEIEKKLQALEKQFSKPGAVEVEGEDIQREHSELTDNIQIAKEWLDLLKTDKTEISEALSFMSSEVNFDGGITTGNNNIQKELVYMRKIFTDPNIAITFTNFEELDKKQIKQFMTGHKHLRKYNLSKDKIDSMILFHLHAIFKEPGEENVDVVFLGFDSKKKIISWFD